jgi:hypothetical protein
MAVMLGATELVDTIVIAHPGPVSTAQIKAIKVREHADIFPEYGPDCKRTGSCFVGVCRR